jgi:hypothetical protein
MLSLFKNIFWRPFFKIKKVLRPWYEAKFVIPPYSEKRAIMVEYQQKFNTKCFVETGTFMGDTIAQMEKHFELLYSIELADALAAKAQKRFENVAKVHILHGDSGEKIKEILVELTQPTLFWLDGHYSGEFKVGDEFVKTGKAEINTPILNELSAILKNGLASNIILIDDARLFNGKQDYPSYPELIHFVAQFNIQAHQVTNKRDIIRIVPVTT